MPLQQLTIQKINDSFGLERVISTLDIIGKSSCINERFYINNIIIYLRTLFIIKVDMVEDLINFETHAQKTLDILISKHKTHHQPELKLIIDILQYNLNYTSNIRKIS